MATLIKQWLNGSPLHLILRESLCFTHLGPVQMPLHSCAEPNGGIKYGKRAASESVWYSKNVKFDRVCRIIQHWSNR